MIPGFKGDHRKFNVVKCAACDFVYINPRYSEKENIELYEESYFTDQVKDLSGKVRSFIDDREDKINDHRIEWGFLKKYKRGGRILDFGSGPGFFLDSLDGNWEKYAVDTSNFSISNIQDPTINKFRGTLFEAEYEDNFFDAIYIGHTLDRLTNLSETLSEVRRVLNVNGVILAVTPNIGSLCARVFKERYRLLYSNHLVYFSTETLKKFFSQSGFKLVDVKYPYCGASFFSYSGFFLGTVKILLQVFSNMFKVPIKMVSPPYPGNLISVIVARS
ncbi:MAG: class I SAM-dependent methyltransferase [Nitrospinales bacterium]|nr:class I SAM-dependent methyltransferase [Nitrospinales bacterium]